MEFFYKIFSDSVDAYDTVPYVLCIFCLIMLLKASNLPKPRRAFSLPVNGISTAYPQASGGGRDDLSISVAIPISIDDQTENAIGETIGEEQEPQLNRQIVNGIITIPSSDHLTSDAISVLMDDQIRQTPPFRQNNASSGTLLVCLADGDDQERLRLPLPEVVSPETPAPNNDDQDNATQRRGTEAETRRFRLTKSSLMIAAQAAITLFTVWFSNNDHALSRNGKILRDFATGSNIVGFFSSFTSILMCGRSAGLANRILTVTGYAGAAFGFLALMGMLLPDNLKLWITLVACAACLPALAAAFSRNS